MTFLRISGSAILFALPLFASAHAFGQQFNLPLPVNYFVGGGLLAFIASCVALLFFSTPLTERKIFERVLLPNTSFLRLPFAAIGFAILLFIFWMGFFGVQDFTINPVPDIFWILLLLLFVYVSALVGGLWRYIDPFKTFAVLTTAPGEKRANWLWFVPSILFFNLVWLELFSEGLGALPNVIATVLVLYTLLTLVMSRVYGAEWFERGDYFSTLFGVVGAMAPLQLIQDKLIFIPPTTRLIHERVPHVGVLFFILLLLSATVIDGLRETNAWWTFLANLNLDYPSGIYWFEIFATLVMPFALLSFYALAMWGMKVVTHSTHSVAELMLRFGYSLVPIAFVYHFAHYFSLIPTTLFNIIPPADLVWYVQLGVIVLGHIAAAVVAHRISQYTFDTKYKVMLSQLPTLILMVIFTSFGLWTLAQPFLQV